MALQRNGGRLLNLHKLWEEMDGPSYDLVKEMSLSVDFPYKLIRSKKFYPEGLVVDWIEQHSEREVLK